MKTIHPQTTLGLVLAAAAVALLFSDYGAIACAAALVGYFFTLPEVPKYTSLYQFVVFPLQGLVLGFTLDFGHERLPYFSIVLLLICFAILTRVIFQRYLLHTKMLWLDPLIILLAVSGWVSVNLVYREGWQSWFYPVMPALFSGHLVTAFYKEGKAMRDMAKAGIDAAIGKPAPDFDLADQNGQRVRLSDLRGKRSVLLVFIRGDWCPACHMMLRSYSRNVDALRNANVLLLAIGPDDLGTNQQMAIKLGLDFRLLTDPGQKVAQLYGTFMDKDPVKSPLRAKYESGGMNMPFTFIICPDGTIRYKSRADEVGEFVRPEKVFDVLEKIAAGLTAR